MTIELMHPSVPSLDLIIPSMHLITQQFQQQLVYGISCKAYIRQFQPQTQISDYLQDITHINPSVLTPTTLYTLPQHNSLIGLAYADRLYVTTLYKAKIKLINASMIPFCKKSIDIQDANKKQKNCIILEEEQVGTIYLFFDSQSQRKRIYNGILRIQQILKSSTDQNQRFVSEAIKFFVIFDTNCNKKLDQSEIINLMKKAGLNYRDPQISKLLAYAFEEERLQIKQNPTNNEKLKYFLHLNSMSLKTFMKFVKLLLCRSQIYPVFKRYTKPINSMYVPMVIQQFLVDYVNNFDSQETNELNFETCLTPLMKIQDMKHFLQNQQKISNPKVLNRILSDIFQSKSKEQLSFYDFCRFLLSSRNNSIYRSVVENFNLLPDDNPWIDYSHSLPNYFVLSSHNTYLTGNQLTSQSSAQIFRLNLQQGVRCLQLDIHDSKEGPILKHGFTFTASISFEAAIIQIAKFSDSQPTHTPIILSFENHCKQPNQKVMQAVVQKYIGKKVFKINTLKYQKFPSLQDLRGKIIIQGTGDFKKMYPKLTLKSRVPGSIVKQNIKQNIMLQTNIGIKNSIVGKNRQILLKQKQRQLPQKFLQRKKKFEVQVQQMMTQKSQDEIKFQSFMEKLQQQQANGQIDTQNKQLLSVKDEQQYILPNHNLSAYYSLIVSQLNLSNSAFQMGNLEERSIMKMLSQTEKCKEVIQYSSSRIIRVYPFGLRMMSSNYNPIPMMEAGAQLISLNTQNRDVYDAVMRGHFVESGNCGYLLKPKPIRSSNVSSQKQLKSNIENYLNANSECKIFTIIFLMCFNLKPQLLKDQNESTFLQCKFLGSQQDNQRNCHYDRLLELSKKFKCRSYVSRFETSQKLCQINQIYLKSNRQTMLKRQKKLISYPIVRINCEKIQFGSLCIGIPLCGIVSIPMRQMSQGYRTISLNGRGDILVYVKIQE